MATFILFPTQNKLVPVNELPSVVLKQLHGLHSIEEALSTFTRAVSGPPDVHGGEDLLSIFDAHVGDCSCHLRAQMLWELVQHARTSGTIDWMEGALDAARQSTKSAVTLLDSIRARKGRLRGLDLGPMKTLSETRIWEKIGGDAFFAQLYSGGSPSSDYSDSSTSTAVATPDPYSAPPSCYKPLDVMDMMSEAFGLSSISIPDKRDLSCGMSCPPSTPPSKRKHRVVDEDIWDMDDRVVVVRFLVICRLLSLHKEMFLESGPPAYIRARTNPQAIYADTEASLLEKWPGMIVNAGERMKRLALVKDYEKMQSYLSQLTANWVCKLADGLGIPPSVCDFIGSTIITNARRVSCVASYTSILPVRAEWLVSGTPILLLVRRFCSEGYHHAFYRVQVNVDAEKPYSAHEDVLRMGDADWFTVEHVSHESVLLSSWARTPHFIYVSNSIDGCLSDFYNRLVEGRGDSRAPHHDEGCAEHLRHIQLIVKHNFSRGVMRFFGQHDQYPFELPDGQRGHDFLSRAMREALGESAQDNFLDEASTPGDFGAPSAHLYTCMHAYLEFPVIVARQVRTVEEGGHKPAPFGYRWAN